MKEPILPDFCLGSYNFDLPSSLIAQTPSPERSASRLMVLHRNQEELIESAFAELLRYLPENCLLVANNSRVVPARILGKRPGGGAMECLLLSPVPLLRAEALGAERFAELRNRAEACGTVLSGSVAQWRQAEGEGLLRPAKKAPPGTIVVLAPDLAVLPMRREAFGRCRLLILWEGDLHDVLKRRGLLPLPPYIKRSPEAAPPLSPESAWGTDAERYQTIYARDDKAGSAAAPTAGLHFTPQLREELVRSGREWEEVTLYVGYGTFSPVRSPDIREHAMHAEYVELPSRTLAAVCKAKREGRAVIAVGTTSARTLEGIFALKPELFTRDPEEGGADPQDPAQLSFAGWTSIFLYPGKGLRLIDGLITNFHLPESSLLMLTAALAGRERILRAYRQAVASGFRFFSYGDAMLIL